MIRQDFSSRYDSAMRNLVVLFILTLSKPRMRDPNLCKSLWKATPLFYPSFTYHFRTKGNKSKKPSEHTVVTKYEKVAVSITFYSHLEACTRWLRTRRPGVRISQGAP
jgi:hypothetical protein